MLEPFSGQVIEGCPYVDRVIPFEFKTIHTYSAAAERSKLAGYLHYLRLIRNERYDAAFVLKRSLSSALLVRLAGVPRRIGFATEGRGLLLTDRVAYRQDQHEVLNFLDCLRVLDIPIGSTTWNCGPLRRTIKKSPRSWRKPDGRTMISRSSFMPQPACRPNNGPLTGSLRS